MHYIIILIILLLGACQSPSSSGHSHDAEGGHSHAPEDEALTTDTTIWTGQVELFVEYSVLIVGQTSRFAAHFTTLDRHQPVTEGRLTVSLIQGNQGIRHTVEAPSSPGIFGPALQPKTAGRHQLVFDLKTSAITERIVMNNVPVFATDADAMAAMAGREAPAAAIDFLKEQAWKIDFQTTPVATVEVYDIIQTSGTWKVSPTDYRTVVATTGGIVSFRNNQLTQGTAVRNGQTLMTISSNDLTNDNLAAQIEQAQATFEQARAAYERKKQLNESQVVPQAELEEAERTFLVARSAYETLQAGYAGGGKTVVAPATGFIRSVLVSNGQYVEQGATLLTLTAPVASLLEVQVSPAYAAQLDAIQDLWYQPRQGQWSSLRATGGTIVSVSREVSRDQPLLSVFARVNDDVVAPEGSFTEAQIALGTPEVGPVVPASALLEDYGHYSVIVQLSGEGFERRSVTIGHRNGDQVAIKSGLQPGEMIVTRGAYQVKMASMSGQVPAHGHTH